MTLQVEKCNVKEKSINLKIVNMETSAELVISHANKKRKRGKNPSLSYNGERNPRKALLLAKKEIIKKSERRNSVFSGRYLIGTGDYCPDCGGLCGNDKHTRRW